MPSEDERFETVRLALAWRVNKSELDTAAEALAVIQAELKEARRLLGLALEDFHWPENMRAIAAFLQQPEPTPPKETSDE